MPSSLALAWSERYVPIEATCRGAPQSRSSAPLSSHKLNGRTFYFSLPSFLSLPRHTLQPIANYGEQVIVYFFLACGAGHSRITRQACQ